MRFEEEQQDEPEEEEEEGFEIEPLATDRGISLEQYQREQEIGFESKYAWKGINNLSQTKATIGVAWIRALLFTRCKCPILGLARNEDIIMTAVVTSKRPSDTDHCTIPIID